VAASPVEIQVGLLASQQGLDHFVDTNLVEGPRDSALFSGREKWIITTGRGSKTTVACSLIFLRHMGVRAPHGDSARSGQNTQ